MLIWRDLRMLSCCLIPLRDWIGRFQDRRLPLVVTTRELSVVTVWTDGRASRCSMRRRLEWGRCWQLKDLNRVCVEDRNALPRRRDGYIAAAIKNRGERRFQHYLSIRRIDYFHHLPHDIARAYQMLIVLG